ncbi:Vacuolar fusion protein mon1 [Friedmanniomyces endolithicus]|nr:Vacuolar fusion protein mon1 [Friedmanniomyces endolithicus]
MEKMFSNRPSTDVRRPLQGTEQLLDGLADGFTRGSPSTLLSALECLRLRKTHRSAINDTLLNVRSPNLLYGLIVAAGRLVSVVRPKKHSLHPGDLHLIFNMLFEADSVKAGGGENWIPLCLPGFNNTGFLYMYVSFFSTNTTDDTQGVHERTATAGKDDELAIVLISANKEGFFELRKMRNALVKQLEKNGSMGIIKTAIRKGHATCSDIVPGTVLRHFLYKSRGNVQFTMPSFEPHFHGMVARRKEMTLYAQLHESIHSRTAHLKVQHCVAKDATALAWETPLFELYCVGGPLVTRAALAQGANRIVQWIKREEERVFIIGGAVF